MILLHGFIKKSHKTPAAERAADFGKPSWQSGPKESRGEADRTVKPCIVKIQAGK